MRPRARLLLFAQPFAQPFLFQPQRETRRATMGCCCSMESEVPETILPDPQLVSPFSPFLTLVYQLRQLRGL